MAYHDDLLRQAFDLAQRNAANPVQADLRRAVSAAYYALFHLLISETVMNWRLESSRDGLARMFEHHIMAKASARILDSRIFAFTGQDQSVVQKLRLVALRFGQLQEKRHTADYDNTTFWTPTEALEDVKKA